MYCPKCGNLVPGDSQSCLYCGFRLDTSPLLIDSVQPIEAIAPETQGILLPVRKRFDERAQWIASGLLFCVALAICLWLILGSRQSSSDVEAVDSPSVTTSYYYIPESPQADRPEVGQVALYDLARKDKEEPEEPEESEPEEQEPEEPEPKPVSPPELDVSTVEAGQVPSQTTTQPLPEVDSEQTAQSMYYLSVESLYYTVYVDETIEIHLTHNCPGVAVFLINDAFGGPYGRYSQSYSYEETSATFYITGSMPGDTLLTFYYKDPDGNIVYSPQVTVVVTQ